MKLFWVSAAINEVHYLSGSGAPQQQRSVLHQLLLPRCLPRIRRTFINQRGSPVQLSNALELKIRVGCQVSRRIPNPFDPIRRRTLLDVHFHRLSARDERGRIFSICCLRLLKQPAVLVTHRRQGQFTLLSRVGLHPILDDHSMWRVAGARNYPVCPVVLDLEVKNAPVGQPIQQNLLMPVGRRQRLANDARSILQKVQSATPNRDTRQQD